MKGVVTEGREPYLPYDALEYLSPTILSLEEV